MIKLLHADRKLAHFRLIQFLRGCKLINNKIKINFNNKLLALENNTKHIFYILQLSSVKLQMRERESTFREVDGRIKTLEQQMLNLDKQLKQKENMLESTSKALREKEMEVSETISKSSIERRPRSHVL